MAITKKTIAVFAALMAFCMVFAGCSSSRKSSDTEVNEHNQTLETTAAYATEAYSEEYMEADYNRADEAAGDEVSGSSTATTRSELNPEEGRLLIRRVTLSVETLNFSELCNNVNARTKEVGGYIETSSQGGTGNARDLRTAYFVIRVPEDKLDSLISEFGGQATIVSQSETTDDVTLDYVDTQSKLEAYRIEQEQLLEMLDEAKDLDTIILLQNELTNVRYEIEYYESSLRMLENQVTYATLTLNIEEVIEETEVEEAHVVTFSERIKDTFEDTMENTRIFFEDLFLGIVAALPVLVPLAVIAVIVAIVVTINVKKARKARALRQAQKDT